MSIRAVTVYDITCDECRTWIDAPRAQDYWASLDDAAFAAEFAEWTYTPERQVCRRCTEGDEPMKRQHR